MTDPVDLALSGFKAVIQPLAPASVLSLKAAYIYPYEEDSWRQQFEDDDLPVAIITQVIGETNNWESRAAGQIIHKWQISVRLLLKRGPVDDSETASRIAKLHNAYVRSTAVLLAGNNTLGGSIALLGERRGGRIMTSSIGNLNWLNTNYWGVYIVVPVQQTLQAQMIA